MFSVTITVCTKSHFINIPLPPLLSLFPKHASTGTSTADSTEYMRNAVRYRAVRCTVKVATVKWVQFPYYSAETPPPCGVWVTVFVCWKKMNNAPGLWLSRQGVQLYSALLCNCTWLYFSVMYSTVLYCIIRCCSLLHCTQLYFSILDMDLLYCTVL